MQLNDNLQQLCLILFNEQFFYSNSKSGQIFQKWTFENCCTLQHR